MPVVRSARTLWEGSLAEGHGSVSFLSSGLPDGHVSWQARATRSNGATSPEELLAAAHSACFSMALSNALTRAGTPPRAIDAGAEVAFQPGVGITGIRLVVRASVPGISAEEFAAAAELARTHCPVSQALAQTTITLEAVLE
ncbi:OsmC family peroxiredoxin [Marinactinospora thermotolerans]|uniref:Osmotically inducible protein OsmC n=1 Tax=Marinactinospora thermotolerans DSM 45154 TaxID=1122192 RepID=A0A1T4K8M5_9ACTN|nr:OsmC family peroxiredoxin [Marinactinospora thermotolerans]SJZ38697.1 osmotically inducible protein OsmC [Marinactinospora thermotolerans DSM 45154]